MTGDGGPGAAKILVIGASGFVGSAIVRAAMASHDLQPIACMRRPNDALRSLGVETRICDATDPVALEGAAEGATYAVNCVLGGSAVMLKATHNLCRVAYKLGVRRIAHMSSMAVYGTATGTVDETADLQPISAYGRAKTECERVVGDFITGGGDAVVLRPGCVYGPGGEQWVGRIARWLQAGRLGDLGEMADGYCNLSFNDDLASAVLASLAIPAARGQAFNVSDPDPGTWNQYFSRLGSRIGAPVRRIPRHRMTLETAILAPPLQIVKIVVQRFGLRPGRIPEPMTPSLLPLWRQRIRLDFRKSDAVLAFHRTSQRQGLAVSADWYLSAVSRS